MKKFNYGIRHYIAAGLLVLAGVAVAFSWQEFSQESQVSLSTPSPAEPKQAALIEKEVASRLARSKAVGARYRIIEEKNLFSEDREPWRKPPPPPKKPEKKKPKPPPPPPPPPPPGTVIYYGSFVSEGERYAIVRFPKMPSGEYARKELVMKEGETAWEIKRPEGGQYYTLVSVTRRYLEVRDNKGRQYRVGLFDHNRPQVASTTPNKVSITTTAAKDKPAASTSSGGSASKAPDSSNALSKDDKEKLVEQGLMKKIITPFGPVYRPIKK